MNDANNAALFPVGQTKKTALEPVLRKPMQLDYTSRFLCTDDKTAQREGHRKRHKNKQRTRCHVSEGRVQHWSRQGQAKKP